MTLYYYSYAWLWSSIAGITLTRESTEVGGTESSHGTKELWQTSLSKASYLLWLCFNYSCKVLCRFPWRIIMYLSLPLSLFLSPSLFHTQNTHTHTHAHTRMHARTHTSMHARMHTCTLCLAILCTWMYMYSTDLILLQRLVFLLRQNLHSLHWGM